MQKHPNDPPEDHPNDHPEDRPNVVCHHFLNGNCRFGKKCKNSHVDDPSKPCNVVLCCHHTVPRPSRSRSITPPRATPPVLKFIVDGGNFYWAAGNSPAPMKKHQKVITALRATINHLKSLYPNTTEVKGSWIDVDQDEYIKFLNNHISDPIKRQALIEGANERYKALCGAMCKYGSLPELTYYGVGKYKLQSGVVEGGDRTQMWIQSAVDESVVCHTLEAYIDPGVNTVVLFTGDGDMAPVFVLCNDTLHAQKFVTTSKKEPLRLSAVQWSCSCVFKYNKKKLLMGKPIIYLDVAMPHLFIAPRAQGPPQPNPDMIKYVKQLQSLYPSVSLQFQCDTPDVLGTLTQVELVPGAPTRIIALKNGLKFNHQFNHLFVDEEEATAAAKKLPPNFPEVTVVSAPIFGYCIFFNTSDEATAATLEPQPTSKMGRFAMYLTEDDTMKALRSLPRTTSQASPLKILVDCKTYQIKKRWDLQREPKTQQKRRLSAPKTSNTQLPRLFVDVLCQRSAALKVSKDVSLILPGKSSIKQRKNFLFVGFKDFDDAKTCATQIQDDANPKPVVLAYGCQFHNKYENDAPQLSADVGTATMRFKDSKYYLFPTEAEMKQMYQTLSDSGVIAHAVRLIVDPSSCTHVNIVSVSIKRPKVMNTSEQPAQVVVEEVQKEESEEEKKEEEEEEEKKEEEDEEDEEEEEDDDDDEQIPSPQQLSEELSPFPLPEFVDAMLAHVSSQLSALERGLFIDFLIQNEPTYSTFNGLTDDDKTKMLNEAKTAFYRENS